MEEDEDVEDLEKKRRSGWNSGIESIIMMAESVIDPDPIGTIHVFGITVPNLV